LLAPVTSSSSATSSVYFWATHAGAELDLLCFRDGRRYGFEFKYADAPSSTKSMHVALEGLKLERLFVVYPGSESYPLGERSEVVSIQRLRDRVQAALASAKG
jgi:hypothetical protein